MPDYEALRGETGGLPPDGVHDAYLDGARLVDTRNGEMLVTDWRTVSDPLYCWSTWFGFEGQRLRFTQDFLDDLGVDRAHITDDDALNGALYARIGLVYTVRTSRWGSNGGGGVNVEVEGQGASTESQQETLDLPHDPVEAEPVSAGADDDDIPF